MLKKTAILGFAMAAVTMPAWSQVSIYLGIAPPPVLMEAPPPPPAPAMMWIAGFWAPDGPRYRWIAGHYEQPPYPGAVWFGPRYERGDRGWGYHRGYWGRAMRGEHIPPGHAYGHYKQDWDDDGPGHGHGHGHGRD